MAEHRAPLREDQVALALEAPVLLGPVAVAEPQGMEARAAQEQSGLKLQTAPRLAQVAAVAALAMVEHLNLPALMAQVGAVMQVLLEAHPASLLSLTR
jgi:hypothetical protein